jgi:hypothetical protein
MFSNAGVRALQWAGDERGLGIPLSPMPSSTEGSVPCTSPSLAVSMSIPSSVAQWWPQHSEFCSHCASPVQCPCSPCHRAVQAHDTISRLPENQTFPAIKLNLLISETLLLTWCRKPCKFFQCKYWLSEGFPWNLISSDLPILSAISESRLNNTAQNSLALMGRAWLESQPGLGPVPAVGRTSCKFSEPHFPHLSATVMMLIHWLVQ